MTPKDYQGNYIALVTGSGIVSAGIAWRIYGFTATRLLVRSVDGGRKDSITLAELELLQDQKRLQVYAGNPLPANRSKHG